MIRVALMLLALGVGFDHFIYGGKYTDATERAATEIYHHLVR